MYRSFLSAALLAATTMASAQNYVRQVLVLNEGFYNWTTSTQDVPVSLGSYDPANGSYQTVVTISDARFGNQVAVNGDAIYVGADTRLLKYDLETYALLDEEVVVGIRGFSFWNDQIIITRGEVGGLAHYVEVRDKNTFDLLYTVSTIDLPYSCEDIEVVGDIAYIAVGNAFEWGNTVGMVGKLNLVTGQWDGSVDLGPNGLNPENLMVTGDALYTLNNGDFTASSISKVSGVTNGGGSAMLSYTTGVTVGGGCGASELMSNGKVYYQEYALTQMARFDIDSDQVSDTLSGSVAPYGMVDNTIDHVIYATTTDFVSTGELNVLAYDGTVLSSTAIGVSAGSLALDLQLSTDIEDASSADVMMYPNPAMDALFVRVPGGNPSRTITITDGTGRVVLNERRALGTTQRFDVAGLSNGLYTLHVEGTAAVRFVKQ